SSAHWRSKLRPTSVEPVKDSLRTKELLVSSPPMALALPVSTDKTPSGTPARWASSINANALKGVADAGLITMLQPAANAAPALRVIIAAGKFHGVMAAQTPMGCLITIKRELLLGLGMVSP